MPGQVDDDFLALPLRQLADAALTRARELGVEHADVRVERIRTGGVRVHDPKLEKSYQADERGLCVPVVHGRTWGLPGTAVITTHAAPRPPHGTGPHPR